MSSELLSSPPLCPFIQSCWAAMQELTIFSATGVRVVGGGALLITMQCNQQPAWTDTPFFLSFMPPSVWNCVFEQRGPINTKSRIFILLLILSSGLNRSLYLFYSCSFLLPIYLIFLFFISCTFVFALSFSTTIETLQAAQHSKTRQGRRTMSDLEEIHCLYLPKATLKKKKRFRKWKISSANLYPSYIFFQWDAASLSLLRLHLELQHACRWYSCYDMCRFARVLGSKKNFRLAFNVECGTFHEGVECSLWSPVPHLWRSLSSPALTKTQRLCQNRCWWMDVWTYASIFHFTSANKSYYWHFVIFQQIRSR